MIPLLLQGLLISNLSFLPDFRRSNSSISFLKFRKDTFSRIIPCSGGCLDKLFEAFLVISPCRFGGNVTNWLGILMMSSFLRKPIALIYTCQSGMRADYVGTRSCNLMTSRWAALLFCEVRILILPPSELYLCIACCREGIGRRLGTLECYCESGS